jgi:purine catabolism regulator
MIERGGFSDFVVYAGEAGLYTREVRAVCVIDTVDIEDWLFGGEFLLTSGYIFKEYPERLGDLIEMSDRKGAAALGVKMGRYIDRIPREVLGAADRLSFPLIGIPFHYAHTDIINPAVAAIANQKSVMMEKSEEIQRRFFDALLEGDSALSIISILRKRTLKDAMFLNASTGERVISSGDSEFGRIAGNAPVAFMINNFHYEAIYTKPHATSSAAQKPGGYLFIDGQNLDEKSTAAVLHAKNALRLHLKWESDMWRIERGRGAQFVQDILYKRFKHASEIHSKGRMFGWDIDGRQAALFVSIDRARSVKQEPEEPGVSAYEIFRSALRERCSIDGPYALLEDGMAFIIKAPAEEWKNTKAMLMETFLAASRIAKQRTGLQIALGAGAPVDDPTDCDKSFREARSTVILARDSNSSNFPCFWEDMGVYRLLAPIHDTQEAREFIREYLGPLIDRGGNAKTADSLLQTLFCIIRNNWQIKPVASDMNLHYNTVKYRYHKIGEILGIDLESYGSRMCLFLAMELYTLTGAARVDDI